MLKTSIALLILVVSLLPLAGCGVGDGAFATRGKVKSLSKALIEEVRKAY